MQRRNTLGVILAVMLVMMLVAGCGKNAVNEGNQAAEDDKGAAAVFPVTIKHAKGETVMEKKPEKAAITYFPFAEHLFAIGEEAAVGGVVGLQSLKNFPVYADFVQNDKIVNLGDETNLEKIMKLNPDVIVAWEADDALYDQLSKIAKTIVISSNEDWKQTITQVAAVFGAEAKAKQYIADYDAKLKEVASLADTTGDKGKTALFLMTWAKGFYYYGGVRMAPYYEQVGFKSFDNLEAYGEITLEGLSKLDPDYIFLGQDFTNTAEVQLAGLEKSPVWNKLKAVQAGQVHIVDTEIMGPLAMGQFKGLAYMESIFKSGK
jgi:iron complex transport system substrate-binding protein